jgi:hypothetical protein
MKGRIAENLSRTFIKIPFAISQDFDIGLKNKMGLKVETYFSYIELDFGIDMKYFTLLSFFVLVDLTAKAQESIFVNNSMNFSIRRFAPTDEFLEANMAFLDHLKDSKLVVVNTSDSYFQHTYLVSKEGETISSGFMTSSYFTPNDNFIVISGNQLQNRDSFNPYEATNLKSALILGTINNFIHKLKINKR